MMGLPVPVKLVEKIASDVVGPDSVFIKDRD
jgi:hypothetical protein